MYEGDTGKPRVVTESNWKDKENIFHFPGLEVCVCVCCGCGGRMEDREKSPTEEIFQRRIPFQTLSL